MEPTDVIGGCTLYQADAMEVLPDVRGVNLIDTDAPYLLSSGGAGDETSWRVAKGYENDGKIVECDVDWRDFMPLLFQACADRADAYFMANDKNVFDAHAAALAAGFRFHNLLAWNKGTCTPNRWYMKNLEYVVYCYKGKAKAIRYPSATQLMYCPNPKKKLHPTQKPVEINEEYIRQSTARGELVMDPFMGSGSTGVAAARLGRRFIGIEKTAKYYDITCKRIEAAYAQPAPFIDAPQLHGVVEALL